MCAVYYDPAADTIDGSGVTNDGGKRKSHGAIAPSSSAWVNKRAPSTFTRDEKKIIVFHTTRELWVLFPISHDQLFSSPGQSGQALRRHLPVERPTDERRTPIVRKGNWAWEGFFPDITTAGKSVIVAAFACLKRILLLQQRLADCMSVPCDGDSSTNRN